MNREVYLDNNATTMPLGEVSEAMSWVSGEGFGNPSSAHASGERGRNQLREARRQVAELLGGDSERIIFTGSGTEANNMVLFSAAVRAGSSACRIVTSTTEHSSVLKMVEYLGHQGAEVVVVPVAYDGAV